jgi:hypothetical protein
MLGRSSSSISRTLLKTKFNLMSEGQRLAASDRSGNRFWTLTFTVLALSGLKFKMSYNQKGSVLRFRFVHRVGFCLESLMPDPNVIVTFSELEKLQNKFNEAVDRSPEGLDDIPPIELATLRARIPSAIAVLRGEQTRHGVMFSPGHQLASLMQSMVIENATDLRPLPDGETLEAVFDTHDWRWIRTLWHMLKDTKKKFPWQKPPSNPESVPQFGKSARLAVFGDWGTGLYGAPIIAKTIADSKRAFDIILHLGDVYYSGTEGEFKDRFTAIWPGKEGAISRSLNGNHEMYSGGRPYFNTIQRAPFRQESTYFAYSNEDWIIACLDTAYEDHDLTQDQVDWLNNIAADAKNRKIVLFSHHQPFSLLSQQGPKLQAKLKNLLEGKKIFAWYWGHEHECVIYDRHQSWNMYGRCVGHAGMPEFRPGTLGGVVPNRQLRRFEATSDSPGALVLDGPNPYIKGQETDYTPHGFVSLEFDGATLVEHFHDPDGTEFKNSELK